VGLHFSSDLQAKMQVLNQNPSDVFRSVFSQSDPSGELMPFMGRVHLYSRVPKHYDIDIN